MTNKRVHIEHEFILKKVDVNRWHQAVVLTAFDLDSTNGRTNISQFF